MALPASAPAAESVTSVPRVVSRSRGDRRGRSNHRSPARIDRSESRSSPLRFKGRFAHEDRVGQKIRSERGSERRLSCSTRDGRRRQARGGARGRSRLVGFLNTEIRIKSKHCHVCTGGDLFLEPRRGPSRPLRTLPDRPPRRQMSSPIACSAASRLYPPPRSQNLLLLGRLTPRVRSRATADAAPVALVNARLYPRVTSKRERQCAFSVYLLSGAGGAQILSTE